MTVLSQVPMDGRKLVELMVIYILGIKLDNPDAETGDLTDWTYSNAAVAAGGPGDSTYRFSLGCNRVPKTR